MTASYPAHREADIVLRDGSTIHVRPIRPDDADRLLAFLEGLSDESRTLRFFSPAVNLPAAARRESDVDYVRSFGLIATTGADERIAGDAIYVKTAADRAEVALTIGDEYQGRGLGTILLGHLAEVAAENGIAVFEAEVLPVNYRMLGVFRESGFPLEVRSGPDGLRLTFPTSLTEEALQRFEHREQIATVNALSAFLRPRSVAVVGASRERGTPGGELFHNLLAAGFAGPVYPVNLAAPVVQSVVAYPSVEAIPGPVDLALVAVPAARVVEVAEGCARKGVRALVVISAGFAEAGLAGRARQAELVRVCRESGMRLIGPNCIGVANTDLAVRLNAQIAPIAPLAGRIGFSSQSGALGIAAVDYAASRGLGISSFVSVGNKADISGNDLLNYWETDGRTGVILLYLESFGNPRKFTRIARRVGRQKPIVVVKSGRAVAAGAADATHTGALLAAADVTVDALFRQAGVIRTDTLQELFDVAALLASQPPPKGPRVGIVTNVGGLAALCADAGVARGLEVPALAAETQGRLRAFLPAEASVTNPVDMVEAATAEHYRQAIRAVAADPGVDAVIAIFIPPLATRAADVARAIVEAARDLRGALPVLAVFMSSSGIPRELKADDLCIPSYAFPESAAIALAHAARYGMWRARPVEAPPRLDGPRRDEAAAIVARALGAGGGWLDPADVAAILACYGLPLVDQRLAETPAGAAREARALDGPVALKAVVPGLLEKSGAGAVRLGLAGPR
ncbi:MAG TPA: GNAT family N-acetyltransferase, partial [Thermomicrobiales bacterium]|nr:GNAT family N-acetyltransferase [Thermomicrobiales bacterium]